jgi:hypothetical protein
VEIFYKILSTRNRIYKLYLALVSKKKSTMLFSCFCAVRAATSPE